MKTFTAVFSSPDPNSSSVFWGAFNDKEEATKAVNEWVETHPYWSFEEFGIIELPFGTLL